MKVFNQQIQIEQSNIQLFIKREDLIHPFVSGNKYRKLKYNLETAKSLNKKTLLTFGGAFSNHIAAVAFAGQENGFQTIGIIRGDELENKIAENPTLTFAASHDMQFHFVSRTDYKNKTNLDFLKKLQEKFGDFYLIPEGGTNELAIKGCEEILTNEDVDFDYICSSIGTSGTICGIINAAKPHQKILGFPALKVDFLSEEITKFAKNKNWQLITNYHFGGYAKTTPELIHFINNFKEKHQIQLDPVYTSKMVFGVLDLIQKGFFEENVKILMIHTGGLQGIAGMNNLLKKKNLTQIK
jgi:1-aminocyclopropane-1-carboxylate deaminase